MCRLISLFIFFTAILYSEPLRINVQAESAILMNADTGAILYQKNPHQLQYPASITKVATVSYALKMKGDHLDTVVNAEQDSIASITHEAKVRANYTLPSHWVEMGSSHIGIKKGESLSFRDLVFGTMLVSGNDSANVIAQFAGGTISEFMDALNAYIKSIGATNTNFTNPHGLHHPNHKTTAYDMALITREALKNPFFRQVVSTVKYARPKTNKQEATTLVQTNRLLKQGQFYYPAAIGVKTGSTSKAQHTFVGAAQKDGRTLIVVLLKTKERNDLFKDSIKLFEAAFNQPKVEKVLLPAGNQAFTYIPEGASKPISTYLAQDLSMVYYPAEEPIIKCFAHWDGVELPIKKDQRVGEVRLIAADDTVLQTLPIFAAEEGKASWTAGLSPTLFLIVKVLVVLAIVLFCVKLWFNRRG